MASLAVVVFRAVCLVFVFVGIVGSVLWGLIVIVDIASAEAVLNERVVGGLLAMVLSGVIAFFALRFLRIRNVSDISELFRNAGDRRNQIERWLNGK